MISGGAEDKITGFSLENKFKMEPGSTDNNMTARGVEKLTLLSRSSLPPFNFNRI